MRPQQFQVPEVATHYLYSHKDNEDQQQEEDGPIHSYVVEKSGWVTSYVTK